MTMTTATKTKTPKLKPFSIEFNRDELVAALNLVGKVMERRTTLPVLSHVVFRPYVSARGSTWCNLIGTDLDCWVRQPVKIKTYGRMDSFTLPWFGLGPAIRDVGSGDDTIMIEVHPAPMFKAYITSGEKTTTLEFETLPTDDFPTEREMKAKADRYSVSADDLLALVRNVDHAISDEQTRYYLHGAYFHCEADGILRAVTTDGHRLVLDEIAAEGIVAGITPVIVPGKTLRVVEAHCAKAAAHSRVYVSSSTDGVTFEFGGDGQIITSKVIDGTYPDYKRVLPESNDRFIVVDNATLDRALKPFPTANKRGAVAVRLEVKADKLTLSMPAKDGKPGIKQQIACEYKGAPFSIGYNPKYLRDALSVLGDQVCIAVGSNGEPAMLLSESEMPQVVLMPMRTV
jgi:DNA polymerase-3 subunit beta